jgi:hypothetical protein
MRDEGFRGGEVWELWRRRENEAAAFAAAETQW